MPSRLVIGVAGRIGSGKSVVARHLADHHGFQYQRYSLVLAEWHEVEPAAKAALQQVGWDVMSGDHQRELNRRLIETLDPKRDCAIDGLRHPIDFESLKGTFTSSFFLIFVNTPPKVRFERLGIRYASYAEFEAADSHPVESHIDELQLVASAVLSGDQQLNKLMTEVDRTVAAFRSGGHV